MKTADILLKPKALESEIESLKLLLEQQSRLLPGFPVLDRIRATIAKRESELNELQSWINAIPDDHIRNTIYAYQQTGDWSQVNCRIYGYPSYHTCRSAVLRFLKKHGFEERFQ